jgi:hypothetical protein
MRDLVGVGHRWHQQRQGKDDAEAEHHVGDGKHPALERAHLTNPS